MTSVYVAECECGFKRSVSVGGTRATFRTICDFPFFCEKCGLVSVNTCDVNIVCPSCKSTQVTQYGRDPVSLTWNEEHFSSGIQAFTYRAPRDGNLCPACKKHSLVFSGPTAIFD